MKYLWFMLTILTLANTAKSARGGRHWGPLGFETINHKITHIYKGSPAHGLLKVGDILSSNNNRITLFQKHFDSLEAGKNQGKIKIELNDGRSVQLKIPNKGSWSPSAPIQCKKCDQLIQETTSYIIKNNALGRRNMKSLALLALLATGKEEAISYVRKSMELIPASGTGYSNWFNAYNNILLCEYYLITKDETVLPIIKKIITNLDRNRDGAGIWGHGAQSKIMPGAFKPLRQVGYGSINATTYACHLSMILAEKCGLINDPNILKRNRKVTAYIKSWVGRDLFYSIASYSDETSFAKNGLSAMAALILALEGDIEEARYFIGISLAAGNDIEKGHTGPYFGLFWTGLGASLAGDKASAEFFKEIRWLRNGHRRWNGGYRYDSRVQLGYNALSEEAPHLLNLARGRKKLIITGKNADKRLTFTNKQIDNILKKFDPKKAQSPEWFITHRNSYNPAKRKHVAMKIGKQLSQPSFYQWVKKNIQAGSLMNRIGAFDIIKYSSRNFSKIQKENIRNTLYQITNNKKQEMRYRAIAAEILLTPEYRKILTQPHFESIVRLLIKKSNFPNQFLNYNAVKNLLLTSRGAILLRKEHFGTNEKLYHQTIRFLLNHPIGWFRNDTVRYLQQFAKADLNRLKQYAQALIDISNDKRTDYHTYTGRHRNADPTLKTLNAYFKKLGITADDLKN